MTDARTELIRHLAERAYRDGAVTLSSGARSKMYVDAKRVMYRPEVAKLAGQIMFDCIRRYDVSAVGGLTIGADAIVSATSRAALDEDVELPGFIVRKDPKAHGLRRVIEGVAPEPGSCVAVVDDVVTSGGSIKRAINALHERNVTVAIVVPLVDREEGGRDAIRRLEIPFESICTLSEIREVAGERVAVA